MSEYYICIFRDYAGNYWDRPWPCGMAAVLNSATLVCKWIPYSLNKFGLFELFIEDVPVCSYLMYAMQFKGKGLQFRRVSNSCFAVFLNDMKYVFSFWGKRVILNGLVLFSDWADVDVTFCSICLVCNSGDGIYRVVFRCKGKACFAGFVSVWLGVGVGLLGYAIGFDVVDLVVLPGLSDEGKALCKKLRGILAKAALLGEGDRLY